MLTTADGGAGQGHTHAKTNGPIQTRAGRWGHKHLFLRRVLRGRSRAEQSSPSGPGGGGGPGPQNSKNLCTKNSQINISVCEILLFSHYEIRVPGGGGG